MPKPTEKQKRFVDEYLIDCNATRAYMAAYPKVKEENVARAAGARLLANVSIQTLLQQRQKDRSLRTEITQDRVLQELAAIGFAKGTDYAQITSNGVVELTSTDELSDWQKAAITAIKETQNGVEIKLADKVKALELLGKHLGMFDKGAGDAAQEIEDDPLTKSIEKVICDENRAVE